MVLERRELRPCRLACHADRVGEVANPLRRHAAPPHAGERRHAWIIPAAHMAVVDETQQLSLAQHGELELESGELDLRRRILEPRLVHEPIVDVAIVLELERA